MIPDESTPIKNDILIEIFAKGKLRRMEMRIICYIIRWSWGFDGQKENKNRRQDWTKPLTETKIAKDINVSREIVCRTIKSMIKRKILLTKKSVNKKSHRGLCYQFNEHFEDWEKCEQNVTVDNKTSSTKGKKKSVNKMSQLKKCEQNVTLSVNKMSHLTRSKSLPDAGYRNPKETSKETSIKHGENSMGGVSNKIKKKNPHIRKFMAVFSEEFKKKFNMAPQITRGKDGWLVKQMLENHTLDELTSLIPYFWRLRDDLIKKNGYTIGMFKARLNKLIELKREEERTW